MSRSRKPEPRRAGHGPSISLIKWTGSKRLQADRIVARFPAEIAIYHEPFLGGGSVLSRLLDSDIRVGRYECSDSFAPLITLWNLVRNDPERLIDGYARLREAAEAGGERHYHEVRQSFNQDRCPVEFFFLLRTCRVGHVRINSNGRFTSAFERLRSGTDPDLLRPVVEGWHRKLVAADVRFAVRDYREVVSGPGDLVYLDPPYRTTASYYGRIGYDELFGWLGPQRGNYLLSLGGPIEDQNSTLAVPADLYDEHVRIEAGDNRLHRLGGMAGPPLMESLYIRRCDRWMSQGPLPYAHETAAEDRASPSPGVMSTEKSGGRDKIRPHSEGISAALRSLLDADPEVKPAEAKRRLAERGMAVSSTLFRVVRLGWRRSKAVPAERTTDRS